MQVITGSLVLKRVSSQFSHKPATATKEDMLIFYSSRFLSASLSVFQVVELDPSKFWSGFAMLLMIVAIDIAAVALSFLNKKAYSAYRQVQF